MVVYDFCLYETKPTSAHRAQAVFVVDGLGKCWGAAETSRRREVSAAVDRPAA